MPKSELDDYSNQEKEAIINFSNKEFGALLQFSVINNQTVYQIDHLLTIRPGYDLNQEHNETPPLVVAAECGYDDIIRLLIKHEADVNIQTKKHGDCALTAAAIRGHLSTIQTLIKCGADLDTQNHIGKTACMMASGLGFDSIVTLLYQNGADINILSADNLSAQNIAKLHEHQTTYNLLENYHIRDIEPDMRSVTSEEAVSESKRDISPSRSIASSQQEKVNGSTNHLFK